MHQGLPWEAAIRYCELEAQISGESNANLMHDYPLVAEVFLSHFGANSSNDSTRVAKWPRSSRRESKHSAQEFLDVVVMFFLSCFVVFLVSTQHFAAMELGQNVSITAGNTPGRWSE